MNFYNEWDGFAADWLESLIEDGLIPNGVVDRRSITDIDPKELNEFTQCHFFAGIGGWSRALELAGWSPDRPVWTGSPPCQSFSTAGKGKGKDDERHLWPVFFNLIRECQPPTVFGEQVAAAIRHGWLDDLQNDFEKEGYAAGAVVLPAGSIGAPHKRERLFFVADSNVSNRRTKQEPEQQARDQWRQPDGNGGIAGSVADSNDKRHERSAGVGRQAQRGAEHSGSISVADSLGKRSEGICGGREKRITEHSETSSSVGNPDSQPGKWGVGAVSREEAQISGKRQQDGHLSDGYPDASQINSALADSCGERCGGKEWGGEAEEKRQSERHSSERSGDSSVGNAEHDGSYGAEVGRSAFETSDCGKKGQDVSCESKGTSRSEIARDIRFWSNSTTVYCRDGKSRPIPTEPALFPLANGIPNRVGILRGAGNAIVPQAAAEIIKAYLESKRPNVFEKLP